MDVVVVDRTIKDEVAVDELDDECIMMSDVSINDRALPALVVFPSLAC